MAALECGICAEPYDLSVRQALSLACGHSLCQVCLQSLPSQLCPICCKPLYVSTSQIALNPSIQSALIGYEVYCPQHLTPTTSFCLAHMWVVCADCTHPTSPACIERDLYTDTEEVWKAVLGEIDRVSSGMQGNSMPVDVQKSLANHYNCSLTVNIQLLSLLYGLTGSCNPTAQKTSSPATTAYTQIPASQPVVGSPPYLEIPATHSLPMHNPGTKSKSCCLLS